VVVAAFNEQIARRLDDLAARLGDVLLGLADFPRPGRDFLATFPFWA